ncbi:hypothetical protein CBA19CS91_26565 [Paraburkholderia hospita]|nr:hypothetical protein CBA19CS91_26565 [Paraburkholderia hospita]
MCLVELDGAVFQSLGSPNDDEFSRHVLYAKGLCPHAAFEVVKSTFVAEWWSNIAPPIAQRHFIRTFEDISFECVRAVAGLPASLQRPALRKVRLFCG